MKKTLVKRAWVNAMETIVAEEVERQLSRVPSRKQSFIRPEEVITYALNRLSPLYANSIRGLEMQVLRGRREFQEQVSVAVRQGIAAVERDPLRTSTPIELPGDEKAERALKALQRLLQNPKLDWDNLPDAVQSALADASQSEGTVRPDIARHSAGRYDLSTGRYRSHW